MKPVEEILDEIKREGYGRAFPGKGKEDDFQWTRDPFHILISTVLSQRTREENTHNASRRLFSEYDSPQEIAEAPLERIKELTRCAGFSNSKPDAIKKISQIIVEEYDGEVPRDIERLLELPLVGRKTANCVLAYAFGIDAICVDTHVHRISNRIGLVDTDSPDETEIGLKETVPKARWKEINSLMVVFGRVICRPRNPKCNECPIRDHCDYFTTLG